MKYNNLLENISIACNRKKTKIIRECFPFTEIQIINVNVHDILNNIANILSNEKHLNAKNMYSLFLISLKYEKVLNYYYIFIFLILITIRLRNLNDS